MPPTGDCFVGLLGLRRGRLTSLPRWCSGSDDLDRQPPEPCPQGVVRVRGPDKVPATQGALGDSQTDDVRNAGRSSQGTHAAGLLGRERLDQAAPSDGRALAIIRSSHVSASACSCEVNAPCSASYSATAARPASMRRARCAVFASQPEYVIPDRSAAARMATSNSEGPKRTS